MSDTLRRANYSINRLPRKKSAIPIYGEKEDQGKYWRCRHCGFICNTDRDSLGPGDGRTYVTFLNDDLETLYKLTVIGGCPLCGSKAWR